MNTTLELFRDGGWGMYPTLVCGLVLVGAALKYALRPERRFVPLLVALNLLTLSAGALGFVSGVITTSRYLAGVGETRSTLVAFLGVGESLNNVGMALMFVTAGAIAVTLGAWKIAFQKPAMTPDV
jgi:hypothetical protein